MYLGFSALMLILFDFSHLSTHFSSLLISSAHNIITWYTSWKCAIISVKKYLNWFVHFLISFMKIKNRRGPKTDPCRTPHWTLAFEFMLFTHKYCSLFVRYEWNQSLFPVHLQAFNFDSRVYWLTQLNALRNPRTNKIHHFQNLYDYTGIVRYVQWPS